jgi:hypothetical protein
MSWLFLILAIASGAVFWVGISLYLRVRHQMKTSDPATPESLDEHDTERNL